uniref:Alternative protein SPIN2B n=1 Tax=Homo sapiens TaxID=9606 RepID=L8E9I8_HUMAN|nr:alternative protein SPIN2B [Homo sapiens]
MMELTVSMDWNFTEMKGFCLLKFFLTGWHHLTLVMPTLQIP